MKILITGSSGFLGRYLLKYMPEKNEIFAHSRKKISLPYNITPVYFDLQEENFIDKVKEINPNLIIHNAAMAGVDLCEVERKEAFRINTLSTKMLAEYAVNTGSRLIYISTDQVFAGTTSLYEEIDKPSPVNYYGQTKLDAEIEIQRILRNYVIIRGALFYGKSLGGRRSFTEYLYNKLTAEEKIKVFSDQFRSPILVDDLAEIIWKISLADITGIYNLGGPERLSRQQMGEILSSTFKFKTNLLEPIKTVEVNLKAPRGLDCSLNSDKIIKKLNVKIKDFSEGLRFSFNKDL